MYSLRRKRAPGINISAKGCDERDKEIKERPDLHWNKDPHPSKLPICVRKIPENFLILEREKAVANVSQKGQASYQATCLTDPMKSGHVQQGHP